MRYAPGTDVSERRDLRSAADVDFEESLGLARTQLVKFDGSVRDAIARLESQPDVVYAQPNYVYHAFAAAPNDTHFGHLWGLAATPGVGALPAWDRSLGAGQVIAVVDTGVDLTHPDLVPNLWSGPGGIHGHDFVDNDDVPDDFNLHGSHVAGTVAAGRTTRSAWPAWLRRRRSWVSACSTRRAAAQARQSRTGSPSRRMPARASST